MDTNFLLALSQMVNFNLSYELDRVLPGRRTLVVLEPVFLELEQLNLKGNPKVKMESHIAIDFVHKFCERWPTDYHHKNIDFILLHYAELHRSSNSIIATNDRQLRRLARKNKIQTLYIRSQRFLELQ
ncbi:MAG: hypothetical protein ACFE8U_12005 [Candidatus Hermodarchaeota archaeon]